MKNIKEECIAIHDISVTSASCDNAARKNQLITSTMEYKEPAVPMEHPRMRTDHFEHARLLLPKINAR